MLCLRLLLVILSCICLMEGSRPSGTRVWDQDSSEKVPAKGVKVSVRNKKGRGKKPPKKCRNFNKKKCLKKCKVCSKIKACSKCCSKWCKVPTYTTTLPTPTTTALLRPWIGGFSESNPEFSYPSPDLTSLPLLDNMENIDKLDLQQAVKWPEFSWETELYNPDSRAFQMFAPCISRLGYTVEGRVYSIICPQQGAYSPTLGSLNVEVTVTGQRGWVNQLEKTMAADMTVVGKIWFGPGAEENPLIKFMWSVMKISGQPFPYMKKNAIVVNTHSRDVSGQKFFSLRDGESMEFEIPEFAKHPEAWNVGNLRVQIGQIEKTGSEVVDIFNQLILDIFNVATGNMLKEDNTLYWNVWFTGPENVNRTEWRNHAEKWRDSIETGHGSPHGDGTQSKYFNGTLVKPFKQVDKWIENELEKIYDWLKKHIHILI